MWFVPRLPYNAGDGSFRKILSNTAFDSFETPTLPITALFQNYLLSKSFKNPQPEMQNSAVTCEIPLQNSTVNNLDRLGEDVQLFLKLSPRVAVVFQKRTTARVLGGSSPLETSGCPGAERPQLCQCVINDFNHRITRKQEVHRVLKERTVRVSGICKSPVCPSCFRFVSNRCLGCVGFRSWQRFQRIHEFDEMLN